MIQKWQSSAIVNIRFCWNSSAFWNLLMFQKLWKLDMVAHACHHSTWEVEVWGRGVQDHPKLYNGFKATLGYMSPISKKKKKNRICFQGRAWGLAGGVLTNRYFGPAQSIFSGKRNLVGISCTCWLILVRIQLNSVSGFSFLWPGPSSTYTS